MMKKDARGNKKIIFFISGSLFVLSLIGIELLQSSPLLFYINEGFVSAFRSRFLDAVVLYGEGLQVSGMT